MSSDDKTMTNLVDLALDVFEDELRCWTRLGTHEREVTRLVRYPESPPISNQYAMADVQELKVDFISVPDKEVNGFLTRVAMQKVVKAIQREILI